VPIVNRLNSALLTDQVPSDIFRYTEMLDRIGEAQLTECADALTRHLSRYPKANLEHGIHALGDLRSYELVRDVLLARPEASEAALRYSLDLLRIAKVGDPDLERKANVLVSLSEAALDGRWPAPEASQRILVNAMLWFVRGNRFSEASKELREKAGYQIVRAALRPWIGKPGGEEILAELARFAPQPDEIPLFIEGLKSPAPQTASECIQALGRLDARDAIPALVAVLDRPDAIADLHPNYRKMTQEVRAKISVGYPPADRDNLAYQADVVLTKLAGGDPSKVPPYANEEILEQRRQFWRERFKPGGERVSDFTAAPKVSDPPTTVTADVQSEPEGLVARSAEGVPWEESKIAFDEILQLRETRDAK
jgi:hypothetical protein